jgi:hypothetical protein
MPERLLEEIEYANKKENLRINRIFISTNQYLKFFFLLFGIIKMNKYIAYVLTLNKF